MAELKTRPTDASVAKFFAAIKSEEVRADCKAIAALMESATKSKPKMWGSAIIGFGTKTIVYSGGREAEWMMMGFSPRKTEIALYGLGISGPNAALLEKLGKHSHGKGCLYIKRLSDVHLPTLKKIIGASAKKSSR